MFTSPRLHKLCNAHLLGVCTFDGPFLSAGNGELRRHINSYLSMMSEIIVSHYHYLCSLILSFKMVGYFGCWAGFLISTYLLNHVMTREREEDEMV